MNDLALPYSNASKRCKQCRPWSRSSLILVCTVCPGLSVRKFRIITVYYCEQKAHCTRLSFCNRFSFQRYIFYQQKYENIFLLLSSFFHFYQVRYFHFSPKIVRWKQNITTDVTKYLRTRIEPVMSRLSTKCYLGISSSASLFFILEYWMEIWNTSSKSRSFNHCFYTPIYLQNKNTP